MKRNTRHFLVLMLFVFLFVASASARLLAPKQGGKEIRVNGVAETAEVINTEEGFSTLMGSEECNEKDEECLNRRMMADAHLDYIYTQHHKKP